MSTILYKFRSATQFTPLHLPGTSARLLDIKRAIVREKKLDSSASAPSSLEFDLQISNAATEEVYADDAIVPRGTRVVVRRVACERGRGILNQLAGVDVAAAASSGPDKSDFYTFRQEQEEEFVEEDAPPEDEKELEALKAVTDQAGEVYGGQRVYSGPTGRPPAAPHVPKSTVRPDADPELRLSAPKTKKRATGIPRTFLSDTPKTEEEDESGDLLASTLVTNKHAFQTLVARSGGQSSHEKNHLSYALKLTSTSLPEHLTCGICHSLVKNAMLVPWEESGRPACESCIRDGLLQNGYKCPMTGAEGVSPEDLFPNVGLRKAAEAFEATVWEKMAEMEEQIEQERIIEEQKQEAKEEEFEDMGEGIVKRVKKEKKRKMNHDFGEDDFGGDVFDVAEDPAEEEEEPAVDEQETTKQQEENDSASMETKDNHNKLETKDESNIDGNNDVKKGIEEDTVNNDTNALSNSSTNDKESEPTSRKPVAPKRRGPPAGYVLGPAGGAGMMAQSPVMFGVNVPPPPPPPPRPNTAPSEKKSDTASNHESRSGSIDLSSDTAAQGSDIPGSPPPAMMGRNGGRFPGRYNDYSPRGGGFSGRGRYNDVHHQGGRGSYNGRGFQGRGGYGRGSLQNNWVSC